MPTLSSSREALLERTFALYWRHLWWWLALVSPCVASAAVVYLLLDRAIAALMTPSAAAPVLAVAAVLPGVAAVAWLLASAIGAQAVALTREAARDTWPSIGDVLGRLAPRFLVTLATSVLVIVQVAALGALGAGAAAALAVLPLRVLPGWGVSEGAARSIGLLVLLPLLVAGIVPAMWWFSRHILAIPLAAVAPLSPWAALRAARAATRGRIWSVLGLVIVTQCAGNVFVLLSRMAASFATLTLAPERFRPIFGEGPLRSTEGAAVQLGATFVALFVTLPLMLLPFAVLCRWLLPQILERVEQA